MAGDSPDEAAKADEEGLQKKAEEEGMQKKAEEDQASSSPLPPLPASPSTEEIKTVARKCADHPVQNPEPGVWAILTAISQKARQRPQGMNIILYAEEHCIGRLVHDDRFCINDFAISGKHCRIYRSKITVNDDKEAVSIRPVFLKDSSTNGTYLNWNGLKKSSPAAKVQHGDIISFLGPPHLERAYAFVFREVSRYLGSNGSNVKRKSEEQSAPESKRVKGIGIGAPDGPILLDDVRSLQRSNMELRKQLESHVLTVENMQNEARMCTIHHENELKAVKESISNSYLEKVEELQHMLEVKQKELEDVNAASAEHRHSIKDLNERLGASMQSRAEADKIINSQKAIISEREAQLDEERNQRRVEREKAAEDLKSALHKAHSEAQGEIKRQADLYSQQHKEQQEYIVKLQELEKESRLLVETLHSKLEDTRESLVMSEKKVRQMEAQVEEEQGASENNKKRSELLELELKKLKKDLKNEKVAREEAWAKVSALELEIAAVIRELSAEKQRFQGARERIILRETQLRAFYSTTEEISALFTKQQEQLTAMQKTLEDEENYDNTSMAFDLNVMAKEYDNIVSVRMGETSGQPSVNLISKNEKVNHPATTVQSVDSSSSNDDASITVKHDCDIRSPDDGNNTQDLECTSTDRPEKGFGSDFHGVRAAAVNEADGYAVDTDGVPETERVLETESQGMAADTDGQAAALYKCNNLAGETMQLEDDAHIQENIGHAGTPNERDDGCSPSKLEDTDAGMIRTADLLASEGLGTWANSTAPSVHGENDSPGSCANAGECSNAVLPAMALCSSDTLAAGSQTNAVGSGVTRLTEQHRALNAMIEIVAPNFKEQFPRAGSGAENNDSLSDAETEEGTDGEGSQRGEGEHDTEASKDDDDAMVDDSVG